VAAGAGSSHGAFFVALENPLVPFRSPETKRGAFCLSSLVPVGLERPTETKAPLPTSEVTYRTWEGIVLNAWSILVSSQV
jgi:hypothetical protein